LLKTSQNLHILIALHFTVTYFGFKKIGGEKTHDCDLNTYFLNINITSEQLLMLFLVYTLYLCLIMVVI